MKIVSRLKRGRAVLFSAFAALLLAGMALPQTGGRPPKNRQEEENNRFIVAFELSPEKGWHFTWPYPSMRPAPYEMVLMKVRVMPRVFDARSRRSVRLPAAKHLEVNGELQKPLRIRANERVEQFKVRLDQGRLRFSLLIPEGMPLDHRYKTARIELYEISQTLND